MGDRLNSPNDIAVRSDGTIYFTDPPYRIDPVTEQELDFNAVFRIAPDAALTAEWRGALESRPKGFVLSPDESILYVAETTTGVMMVDVNADGSLANERDFVEVLLGADGMAMDTGGNLFVSAAAGVQLVHHCTLGAVPDQARERRLVLTQTKRERDDALLSRSGARTDRRGGCASQ